MIAENRQGSVDSTLRRTEIRTLILYAAGLSIFALPLASMLTGAWDSEGVGYHTVWGIVRLADVNIDVAVVLPVGILLGVLTVLWFDDLKRIQAALITCAVVLVGAALVLWRWSVNVDFRAQIAILLLGLIIGFLIAGGHRIYTEEPLREFRRTFFGLYIFVSLFLVISFFENHLLYSSPIQQTADGLTFEFNLNSISVMSDGIFLNLIAVIAFVGILRKFIQYEDKSNIFILGPKESGKTTLITGLFSYSIENTSARCSPADGNFELRELYTDMETALGFGDIDDSSQRHSFIPLSFEYSYGNIFSQYVTVRMVDYPGEILSEVFVNDVYDAVSSRLNRSLFEKIRSPNKSVWPEQATELPKNKQSTRMAELICDSDTLVLIVPMADFIDDIDSKKLPDYYDPSEHSTEQHPSDYLAQYDEILQQHQSLDGDRDVIVIVTMSDLLIEDFEQTNPGMTVQEYDEFRSYIRDRVFVLNETGSKYNQYVDDVYPFFFQMDENRIPQTDSNGIYGAREIIERISR